MSEDIHGIAQVETKMGGCVINAIKKIHSLELLAIA
jgi:hypothetical protein